MTGKSQDKNSRKMVEMQEQEARDARAKEAARQGRLDTGLESIKALFRGGNTYGTRQVAGAPTTSRVQGPPTTERVWVAGHDGSGHWDTRTVPGKMQSVSAPGATTDERYVTGTSSGIGDEFYNDYGKKIVDYYQPQVQEKFGEAQDQTTYNLARAGQLRSDVATTETAKLAKDKLLKDAEVRSKADVAMGDLRDRTAKEEQTAIAQLYATENPEVAANTATSAINAIRAEEPDLTPLAQVFDVASIGGAGYLKGAQNAEYLRRIGALPKAGSADSIVE